MQHFLWEINNKPFPIYLKTTGLRKPKFESVPGEMARSEIFVELGIEIVEAPDWLNFKKKRLVV
jgi:hypothetical protein